MKRAFTAFLILIICSSFHPPGTGTYQLAVVKYSGGGDWYGNLETSLPNLIKYCNENLKMDINPEQATVEVGSPDIYNYPFLHLTGHGNVVFSAQEAENLRNYLISGGFLHISDNYGLDQFIRPQMKKVFPELDFVELPYSHPIYHQSYDFTNGPPKVHEHDGKPAQGFGLIYNGRLVCYYDYQCDLGDGWESQEVHHDSPEIHEKALKMGANMLQYVLLGGKSVHTDESSTTVKDSATTTAH